MTDYAKSSAHNLCEVYKQIFINYQNYGNVVLDVHLKDEPEIQEIFLKSETFEDYKKNIKEFWVQNNQIVISTCSDIEKAYDSGIYDEDIPVKDSLSESDLSDYYAVVTVDFFDRLCSNQSFDKNNKLFVYVETDKFIYKINFDGHNMYHFIAINAERISKDDIVTD